MFINRRRGDRDDAARNAEKLAILVFQPLRARERSILGEEVEAAPSRSAATTAKLQS